MENAALARIGKKLGLFVAFLAAIAVLIGGEDNPGMLAQVSKERGQATASTPPVYSAPVPTSESRPASGDSEQLTLDDWYAEVAPPDPTEMEAAEPEEFATDPVED